jgi:hypothetical protein
LLSGAVLANSECCGHSDQPNRANRQTEDRDFESGKGPLSGGPDR